MPTGRCSISDSAHVANGFAGLGKSMKDLVKNFGAPETNRIFGDRGAVNERDAPGKRDVFFADRDTRNYFNRLRNLAPHGFVRRRQVLEFGEKIRCVFHGGSRPASVGRECSAIDSSA